MPNAQSAVAYVARDDLLRAPAARVRDGSDAAVYSTPAPEPVAACAAAMLPPPPAIFSVDCPPSILICLSHAMFTRAHIQDALMLRAAAL